MGKVGINVTCLNVMHISIVNVFGNVWAARYPKTRENQSCSLGPINQNVMLWTMLCEKAWRPRLLAWQQT
jgi:hypothetical protein